MSADSVLIDADKCESHSTDKTHEIQKKIIVLKVTPSHVTE